MTSDWTQECLGHTILELRNPLHPSQPGWSHPLQLLPATSTRCLFFARRALFLRHYERLFFQAIHARHLHGVQRPFRFVLMFEKSVNLFISAVLLQFDADLL